MLRANTRTTSDDLRQRDWREIDAESHQPPTQPTIGSRASNPTLSHVVLEWSERWESKIPLGHCAPFRIMVLQAWLSTACDYCAKNVATRANASQCPRSSDTQDDSI